MRIKPPPMPRMPASQPVRKLMVMGSQAVQVSWASLKVIIGGILIL